MRGSAVEPLEDELVPLDVKSAQIRHGGLAASTIYGVVATCVRERNNA